MASDDTITTIRSSIHDDDDDLDDDIDDDHHNHRHNMSRLSMCTTNIKHSFYDVDDDDNGVHDNVTVHMSHLSIDDDGSEVEADGELSDEKDGKEVSIESVDDSDKETGWLSLPAAPRRAIRRRGGVTKMNVEATKEYASENEARTSRSRRKESRRVRERWLERAWGLRSKQKAAITDEIDNNQSGESECVVIARPKGGERCLCMDMDEVKACKDLGFELQHEWTLEIPSRISGSTIDTDSGGNSPMANWKISSPGDDPRDVKARLKVWAQAVALASATRLTSPAD
ncbi:uncharacterized protein LOC131226095 [Magnolia sinica]|uniref:uncharacterized protein LOC131226095 n=1 Tax=Magnolia sinica TaxID=86752 RepID=UPI00265AF32A|nr:uncharacterized protein LOC131226095 [Magnolia sinica]